jgi:CTP:molybdopterin cytidylyltransferase MocA
MTNANVAAIILAAGASSRLGTPKQLVEYKGEMLLARAIRLAREAGLHPLIVVLGAERESIREAVKAEEAVFVENNAWREGIASSMLAGLNVMDDLAPHSAGVLIMPCDQPRLSANHLRQLLTAFSAEADRCIVCSTYARVRGVPAVFPPTALPLLKNLAGDVGARKILANPPCRVIEVPFAGGEIDIDAPEDLAQLE